MGYEIKLIVGPVYDWSKRELNERNHFYLSTMATVDLCKPGNAAHILDFFNYRDKCELPHPRGVVLPNSS